MVSQQIYDSIVDDSKTVGVSVSTLAWCYLTAGILTTVRQSSNDIVDLIKDLTKETGL